jgi:hypothetical protein
MNREQRLRRCRPRLEALETREMPSTLHVIGPVPGPHSTGPYLNLIVLKPSNQSLAPKTASDASQRGKSHIDSDMGHSGTPAASRRVVVRPDYRRDHHDHRLTDLSARH